MFKKEVITTADDYREIVRFTNFKRKKATVPIMIAASVLATVALILGIIGVIPIIIGIIAAVTFAGVALYFPLSTAVTVKNGIKNGKVSINAKRTFEYDTANLKIYGGRTETDINALWHTIFAIYETERSFLIYITFEKAFCLCKDQLNGNEVYKLRNYFMKKLEERYYIMFKR
ncbi:MAG: YcxB family protein [Ruminococcaceae bacterium]|nr:YcxB family protein [Oscillospiraceae bacterium]